MSKQILRSATSVGANSEEASGSISKREFRAEFFIAYKEARETHYWLRLLKDSHYITKQQASESIAEIDEIMKIIEIILKTVSIKIMKDFNNVSIKQLNN